MYRFYASSHSNMIDHYDKINEKIASETAIGDSIEDLENNAPIDLTPRDIRLCGHRFGQTGISFAI